MRVSGRAGAEAEAGGGPSPDALSPPGSDEAEDPGLHPRADADALRVGPGGTAAGPGTKSGSGHPRPCTRLRKTPESKLPSTRATPPWSVQGGACAVGRGWRLRSPPAAFLAVARGHIWPTCGSHYRSQGLRTAIFIHRMAGGWGGCLLRTPAPPRPTLEKWQAGGALEGSGICPWAGFRNPAVRQGRGRPGLLSSPDPSQLVSLPFQRDS